jgi:hypothetical protein
MPVHSPSKGDVWLHPGKRLVVCLHLKGDREDGIHSELNR